MRLPLNRTFWQILITQVQVEPVLQSRDYGVQRSNFLFQKYRSSAPSLFLPLPLFRAELIGAPNPACNR